MEIRGVKLTPSLLGISFGVWLLAMSGLAGFYVPGGPSKAVEPVAGGSVTGTPISTIVAVPSRTATAVAAVAGTPGLVQIPATTPLPQPSPTRMLTPTSQGYVSYTVKSGDTLSQIAEAYGVTSDAIVRYNNLRSPDDLQIGDNITIPTASPPQAPTSTPTPAPYVVYTVESGDTLSQIAERHGVSTDTIVRYNGLSSADDLQVGDKITIPLP